MQFVVTAATGNLNGNMYEVRKMRELRQPTLLSVFFVCIYSCPVSVLFGIGNAIGSSAIIRRKGQATTKAYRNAVNKVMGFNRKSTHHYPVISEF